MHHLILLLPLIGIIVFWLLPLNIAIPAYIGILIISGLMYWAIIRAIRKIPTTGISGMIGAKAVVKSRLIPQDEAQYMVQVGAEGELWKASSSDQLKPGDIVSIQDVKGLVLEVRLDSAKK
jgi:membrane protein implicated in regulation of membrane protease activity